MALDKEVVEEIEKFALQNAVKYGGKANPGAVMGHLLSKRPELKANIKELSAQISDKVAEVNALGIEKQEARLKSLAPELLEQAPKQESKPIELAPLEGAVMGKVVTRAAPNPNGPIHLGSARAGVLSFLYAQKYKGTFILRFDDTSPKTKPPLKEAYEWTIDDFKWLGAKIDRIEYASKRLERYYEVIEQLINMGKAYVCSCPVETWRALIRKSKACPCRGLEPEEHMKRWKGMLTTYKENEGVLRIKTTLTHKDPGRRDWWGAKVIENANHPIAGNKYRVWPSYNLQSSVDDHDFGVTHIIRGQEHTQNAERQKYIFRYFGWKFPRAFHHGRVILPTGGLSTSKTAMMIKEGKFTGWDDPRLITIRALRRRGFQPEAIREIEISVGLNTNDVILGADKIAAFNRKIIDKVCNRYMFVQDPVRIEIEGAPSVTAQLKLHPDFPERGVRKVETRGVFFITSKDFQELEEGKLYRLMDCLNFERKGNRFLFKSTSVEEYRKGGSKIIHWVADGDSIESEVLMPDGNYVKGVCESALRNIRIGEIVQFNRFGFSRLEHNQPKLRFIYTHD